MNIVCYIIIFLIGAIFGVILSSAMAVAKISDLESEIMFNEFKESKKNNGT